MIHTIEIPDRSGHLTLTWDPTVPESVERALADFEQLRREGYQFFRILNQDEPVGEFASHEGALVVKRIQTERVTAEDVEPRMEPAVPPTRRGRVRLKQEQPERVLAIRPMRGG